MNRAKHSKLNVVTSLAVIGNIVLAILFPAFKHWN